MSKEEYTDAVQRISGGLNTEDTYTLCFWGCSRYVDACNGVFTGLLPLGMTISFESFLEEWPCHFVLYTLDSDSGDPRHLERRKTYFVDVMFWSSQMQCPELLPRYIFRDELRVSKASEALRSARTRQMSDDMSAADASEASIAYRRVLQEGAETSNSHQDDPEASIPYPRVLQEDAETSNSHKDDPEAAATLHADTSLACLLCIMVCSICCPQGARMASLYESRQRVNWS
eukprot:gnl/TRDRNA2_/TRDRNA2_157780_c1_seq1.p1 gnl/TRDRNA2_/TRDRNA2_157780_c1~~gnl/TRDRNA2_/TRDRNA2_157780_c1_seq1.p1  ORF type:complete len:238 (+),score=27.44 gnl/TRDRNA2_/TRDRNA2_157780_c1_seq1:23-715(+)